ncbi:Galactose oxidase [Tetrabaena socialis]|uniref:Galactose oxidase n=1 Tax=Tetrabaena socialis TaxID=47790 RepID=A0A2J7ZL10_9CHLO|nr:Galactose oxidase [Tetrabaena socialis]|eukprot:PNH00956.1 Galactose oxidase [Tetrabaena socialis]
MEKMNARRVMADAVLLPNGCVILLNGAQNGVAGDSATGGSSKAHFPQFWAVLYDPYAPPGNRFTRLARSQIARMYHSTAALTPDGTVLVAGCDRCDYFNVSVPYSKSPWGLPEYRVEVFYPPFYFWDARPTLLFAPEVLAYGASAELAYDSVTAKADIDGVVLMAPSSTTHSTNFNQRAVGLRILSDDNSGTLVVQGPPNRNIAPPGWYMLFLLSGQAYSGSMWVQLLL